MNHRPPEGRVILVDRPSWTTPQSMADMGQMADCSISEATDSFAIHFFGCTRSRPVFLLPAANNWFIESPLIIGQKRQRWRQRYGAVAFSVLPNSSRFGFWKMEIIIVLFVIVGGYVTQQM
jgi:hypothetical protein